MNWTNLLLITGTGGITLGLIAWFFIWRWERKHGRADGIKEPRNYLRDILSGFIILGVIWGLAATMIFAGPYLIRGIDSLLKHIGLRLTQISVGFAVLALGGILFVFRMTKLKWYGRIEVLFAAVVAVVTARQFASQPNWLAVFGTLGGCVYVVVRGLSNILEGSKQEFQKRHDERFGVR